MNREIKFRGHRLDNSEWVYGYLYTMPIRNIVASLILTNDFTEEFRHGTRDYDLGFHLWKDLLPVDKNTVGQFTGLYDKKGTPIYEGDIVEFYETKTYCINPDCEHHLIGYNDRLYKRTYVVEFKECSFGVDGDYFFVRLSDCGFSEEDIEELKDREKNDAYFDTNGYEIDNSIVGIKVVGNIHEEKNGPS